MGAYHSFFVYPRQRPSASEMSEHFQILEINAGKGLEGAAFTANGECLVGGGEEGVRVWRVKDGKRVGSIKSNRRVYSVAVSKDGRYIAGQLLDEALVWDTSNYKQVFVAQPGVWPVWALRGVDFSPDSTRLVTADGEIFTATIWDIAARQKVRTLDHGRFVEAAKYSPQGDRVATAGPRFIRVWDSNDGRLLLNVESELILFHRLLWSNNHLFVATYGKIRQVDASTGSTLSEWSVPASYDTSTVLSHNNAFIAHASGDNVTFWHTSTHTQLGILPGRSIAFSPVDNLLAIIREPKIIIRRPSSLIKGPEIQIDNATLDAWKHDQLAEAEALLTAAIPTSTNTTHHILASRALIRARLRQWDVSLFDAEESIETQPSVIGYIAKCVVLVGKGDTNAGCRVCDIASLRFCSDDVGILLLIKAIVLFMAGEHDDAMSRIDDLFRVAYFHSELCVIQAYMHLLLGNSHMDSGEYESAIQSFNLARVRLGARTAQPPLIVSLISGWKFDDLAITIQQRSCEALLLAGRANEAGDSVLRMVDWEGNMAGSIETWVCEFMRHCLSTPEHGSVGSAIAGRNNAPYRMTSLLREWARLKLATKSWKDVLASAANFVPPRFTIYQVVCDHLEATGNTTDAVSCFQHMYSELSEEIDSEAAIWTRNFRSRCCKRLEDLGDIAVNTREYDEAISKYNTSLSLDPVTKPDLLVKRSMAHFKKGEWNDALNDANEVISLDPDSPFGYEKRHAALHRKGDHVNAIIAYDTMLLKMSRSSNPEIRGRSHFYVQPDKKRAVIHTTINDMTRGSPPILIDTLYGRLCDKSEQASTFEKTPAFTELISSMTTHIDHAHIDQEVQKYFRYATFSHKWEENEPLFEKVIRIVVYDLESSPAHEKLQMFCKIMREAGFNWAWSDTCCINKGDNVVLQEALVSMFRWYEGSAMTIIFLRGVDRLARRGALTRNIWNMRAWTLQEYHASKVVRIYTEDWTPYLGLEMYNHKESPEVISEMEEATGISAQALMALRPGLNDIREKLQLASTRQTTRIEDAAYSLLGIFSLSLPITYGEGDQALGRLLSQLLTSSGDASILAWTGRPGSFNSCLPFGIIVFHHPSTSHIPLPISKAELETVTPEIRSLNFASLSDLYDRVKGLAVPSFAGRRMKLPCLTFKLGQVSVSSNGPERVFRARTNGLGIVEIRADEDLSQLGSLYLIHPWIEFLLDRQLVRRTPEATNENTDDQSSVLGELPSFGGNAPNLASTAQKTRTARLLDRLGRSFGGRPVTSVHDPASPSPPSTTLSDGQSVVSLPETASLLPPSTMSPSEKKMRVLQFIARLRQPFGALLLAATRQNMDEYRRVAAETLITVQVEEITPEILNKLINGVRVLDVL